MGLWRVPRKPRALRMAAPVCSCCKMQGCSTAIHCRFQERVPEQSNYATIENHSRHIQHSTLSHTEMLAYAERQNVRQLHDITMQRQPRAWRTHTIMHDNIAHTLKHTPCQGEQTLGKNNRGRWLQANAQRARAAHRTQCPSSERPRWKQEDNMLEFINSARVHITEDLQAARFTCCGGDRNSYSSQSKYHHPPTLLQRPGHHNRNCTD